MIDIMLDLETRGTVPGCIAFSIGAVEFCLPTGTLGREFYTVISIDDCLEHYLFEDQDTVDWWNKQTAEARVALDEAMLADAPKLKESLAKFNNWQKSLGLPSKIRMWGNGADFDNPILRAMYHAAGIKPYAGGYGGRCYRTLKNVDEVLGPEFKFHKLERTGTHHNALDDAKSQALHLMANVARIRCNLFGGKE